MTTGRLVPSVASNSGPVRSLPNRPLRSALVAAFLAVPLGTLICTAAQEPRRVEAAAPQAQPKEVVATPRVVTGRQLLDLDVVSATDVLLGTIADVLILENGTLLLALVEPAEVLNARGHLLPVPWEFLGPRPVEGGRLVLRLEQEPIAMRSAPRVNLENEPRWTDAAWIAELREAYRNPLTGRRPAEAGSPRAPAKRVLPRWWSLASLRGAVIHGVASNAEEPVQLGRVHELAADLDAARVTCLGVALPDEGAAIAAAPWAPAERAPTGTAGARQDAALDRTGARLVLALETSALSSAPAWDIKNLRGEPTAARAWLESVRAHYERERTTEEQR